MGEPARSTLLVLASTYPRWREDPEPGFVHELCRRLVDRFDVIALVPDAPGADPSGDLDGVEVVRFRYAPRRWQTLVNHGGIVGNLRHHKWKWLLVPGFVMCQYLAAMRLIRNRRVDVIHAHWLIPQGLIAWRLKRIASIPYVVTSHGGDLYGLQGAWLTKLKQKVAGVSSAMTVVSTAMQAETQAKGLMPAKLAVLPMGVDLRERFVVDSNVERAENELLFVGRLVAKKGLPALLKAMPIVLDARPGSVLTIAGFGPEESGLRALVHQWGIEKHVKFLGAMPQDRLPELYRRAAVFVAPFIRDASGDQEGLPVVLMEAIGCGCPVVVGNVAGIRDLLGDAAEEVCVDPTDTHALAASILAVLDHPEQALHQAKKIRETVAKRIDWGPIADGYARIIEGCVEEALKGDS
ncbi:MAG TPA: glycosyltransferase [Dyella sp.]|uniref:glycosyltransferase n=1 Tax=Dyella sp. TaxID=1869338 RepID=UPI002C675952|nr:glycosyltransferase [Dyella sp.]HUB91677.1 glycosyltransferase [Dyella sp.]